MFIQIPIGANNLQHELNKDYRLEEFSRLESKKTKKKNIWRR